MIVDTEATTGALHDLRRARRQNRIQNIHWIDALYRVYLVAEDKGITLRQAAMVAAIREVAAALEARGIYP